MPRIKDRVKFDVAVVPQALNNTNVTGRYFSMADSERALALLLGGAMAATKTSKVEFLQATDELGSGSKAVASSAATVTANTLVTEATLALATVLAADAVTINGLTFTAHATVTTKASRQFSISGNDSADADELVSCINDATYGVPNVFAVNSAGTITLRSTDGKTTISITSPASTITAATTKEQAYSELNAADLDTANGFIYIAVKVTTTANSVVGAALLRSGNRHSPTQAVGASAVL